MSTAELAEVKAEEAGEPESGIRIGDKVYPGPEDWTIGEAEIIQQYAGITPQELIVGVQEDPTNPVFLRAIAWTVLHRSDAKIEWDDKRITEASISAFFEVPEEATKNGPPSASRRKRSS